MRIGFTGTQRGMTPVQKEVFLEQMGDHGHISEFHHGDCIGADADAHDIVVEYGHDLTIVIHPPTDPKKRAWRGAPQFLYAAEELFKRKQIKINVLVTMPYLVRNRDIVNASDWLIACPEGMTEQLRSGTWSTVRHARRVGKPRTIIYPDGSVGE